MVCFVKLNSFFLFVKDGKIFIKFVFRRSLFSGFRILFYIVFGEMFNRIIFFFFGFIIRILKLG